MASNFSQLLVLEAVLNQIATNTGGGASSSTAGIPKFASVAVSASGDNTLITPAAGKRLVLSAVLLSAGATLVSMRLRQGTVAQGQSNLMGAVSAYDLVLDFPKEVILDADKSLVLNLGSATAVNGYVVYREV